MKPFHQIPFPLSFSRLLSTKFVTSVQNNGYTGVTFLFSLLSSKYIHRVLRPLRITDVMFLEDTDYFFSIYLECIWGCYLTQSHPHLWCSYPKKLKSSSCLCAISSVLFSLLYIHLLTPYSMPTSNVTDKSSDHITIELLMTLIGLIVLFYLNYGATFYIIYYCIQTFPTRCQMINLEVH